MSTDEPTVGWALCQPPRCPTHTPNAQHHIKVEVHPWSVLKPASCPECSGELKLDLYYGKLPQNVVPESEPKDTLF